jgi:hypothetical protein
MTETAIRDNAALSRFELDVEGAGTSANYRRTPGTVIIKHIPRRRARCAPALAQTGPWCWN